MRLSFLLSACAVLLFAVNASAEVSASIANESAPQCAELVKECFASDGVERSNCFFSSAKHPFCEGTALGKLTYKRWIMSPVRPGGPEAAPEFLGPQLVDQLCLSNFDNTWMSKLIDPESLAQSVTGLEKELSKCTKEISDSLTRP